MLLNLPYELLVKISIYLSYDDIMILHKVNPIFRGIVDDDIFWKNKIIYNFPNINYVYKQHIEHFPPKLKYKILTLSKNKIHELPHIIMAETISKLCEYGDITSIRYLIESDNIKSDPEYKLKYYHYENIIVSSSIHGNLSIIVYILDSINDKNTINKLLQKSLLSSTQVGNFQLVQFLLEKGTSLSLDVAIRAVRYGQLEILKYIIGKYKIPLPKKVTPIGVETYNAIIIEASKWGKIDIIKYFMTLVLQSEYYLHNYDFVINGVLINGTGSGHLHVVQYAIENGATDIGGALLNCSNGNHPYLKGNLKGNHTDVKIYLSDVKLPKYPIFNRPFSVNLKDLIL